MDCWHSWSKRRRIAEKGGKAIKTWKRVFKEKRGGRDKSTERSVWGGKFRG